MRRPNNAMHIGSLASVWLTRAWTVMILGFVLSEFFHWHPIPMRAPFGYLLILSWYAIWNGVKLWGKYLRTRRSGEWIVYGWIALYIALFITDWVSDRYEVTEKMMEVFTDICIIFAATLINKAIYLRSLKRVRRKSHASVSPPNRHA